MKKYVLIVSEKFPKTHKRSGEDTNFVWQISKLFTFENTKIHTLRKNYELWRKRAKEINKGKAILSIRYWSGEPYRSKQVEICRLEKIGVQKLESFHFFYGIDGIDSEVTTEKLAINDGLSLSDFEEWFKKAKYPMAIIHFTDFRY